MLEKLFKANEIPVPVKDVDTVQGKVKAYFAVFGNKDSDDDIIEPGAFAKSIAERGPEGNKRIKHLKYHDTRQAPGKLLELGEDAFGGWFVSQLSKSTLGKDTLIEYQEEIITEHSHGFQILQSDLDEVGINHIKESRLWEVSSLAAWGANPLTRTEYVKDIKTEDDLIKALKDITDRLKVGGFSDDYLKELEKAYTALNGIYVSLGIKQEPDNTPVKEEPIRFDVLSKLL